MSDKATETGNLTSETNETPNPSFSQDNSNSSPGDSDAQLDALIEKLSPRLEKVFEKMSQSQKDKGIASAKKDASTALEIATSQREVVERFKSYLEVYGNEAAALREMDRDDRINALSTGTKQEPVSVGSDARPWGVRQKEILESAGLQLNDQRAKDLAKSKTWANPNEYISALEAASLGWAVEDTDKPKPNNSTVANTTPGKVPITTFNDVTDDAIGQEILDLSKDYSKNKTRIAELKAELESRSQGAN